MFELLSTVRPMVKRVSEEKVNTVSVCVRVCVFLHVCFMEGFYWAAIKSGSYNRKNYVVLKRIIKLLSKSVLIFYMESVILVSTGSV